MSDAEIVAEARDNLTLVETTDREIREESKRCNRFLALEQWEQAELDARGGRITVVIDQLGQYRDQVVNDWRRNRLGVKVSPGDGGTVETARVYDGLIRHVEYKSKAHVAYDYAFESMTGGNTGYCQVTTKRRPGSFKKDIAVLKIPNPDSVYFDPYCLEIDYSDATFALKTEAVNRATRQKKYPGKKLTDFTEAQKQAPAWFPDKDTVLIAEYWRVEERERKIQLLTKPITVQRGKKILTTDTVYNDEYDELPEGVEIARNTDGELMEDDEPERIVWQYLLDGTQVLEKTRWPGKYIPIVPWYGKEVWYNGKKKRFSLISRSLDAQKVFNYAQSSMAERLGQANRTPVVGYVGQFKTMAKQWAEAATKLFAFLEVDPVMVGDKPAPLPQRTDFDPRIDQSVVASNTTKDNIRGTMGINTSMLGQDTGKAKSGKAVEALAQEGDNATFDFLDNGGRALELVGCIMVDLIPKIYTDADIVQIMNEQQETLNIAINQDLQAMQNPPKGQKESCYLCDGEYHVTVSASPSHQSLRKEGEELMQELAGELPDPNDKKTAIVTMLRLSDAFGAKELAEKLDPKQKQQIPPEVQRQLGMSQKAIQALTEEVHNLKDILDNKQLELDARWKEKCLDAYVKLRTTEITASKDADKQDADIEAGKLEQMIDNAHEVGMAAMEHTHNMELANTPPPVDPNAQPEEQPTQ